MTSLLSPEIVTAGSLTERCDSCAAAAKIELTLAAGGTLAFCGHHANKHADRLAAVASKVTVEEGFDWAGSPTPA
jgi:hypothetical protein